MKVIDLVVYALTLLYFFIYFISQIKKAMKNQAINMPENKLTTGSAVAPKCSSKIRGITIRD